MERIFKIVGKVFAATISAAIFSWLFCFVFGIFLVPIFAMVISFMEFVAGTSFPFDSMVLMRVTFAFIFFLFIYRFFQKNSVAKTQE